jgi:hypothetical protein
MGSYYELKLVTILYGGVIESIDQELLLGCTDYIPKAAEIENTVATTGYTDGGAQQYARWRNTQEEVELKFNSSADFDAVEVILNRSHLWAENVATLKTYLYARHIGEFDWHRSRLHTARLTPSDGSGAFLRSGSSFLATLAIERDYYWEEAAAVNIFFDDPLGAGVTITRNMINDWSLLSPAATAPFAKITRSRIRGTLPTPIDLIIKNTNTNIPDSFARIHIGHNWRSEPAIFDPRISSPALSIFISGTAEVAVFGVGILSANIGIMRSAWFRWLFMTNNQLPADALFSMEITDTFGALLYKSPQVPIWYQGQSVIDVGSLPLPPASIPLPATVNVVIKMQAPTNTGVITVERGAFLMPTDSYRMLLGKPASVLRFGDTLYDLQSTDSPPFAVTSAFGTSYYPLTPHYGKIWLMPERDNGIYFVVTDTDDRQNVALTFDVVARYRPRRLTI